MVLKDNIYGKFDIKEPILIELIKCTSIQRLKGINQYGIPDKYYHLRNFSRYEHSIGVMLLLRKLGASLEEQVAGLLHDASVLAFSHITDWVFADGKTGVEDYHNSIHDKFIKRTNIPSLLGKYGFTPERVLNEDNHTLLEDKIPDLCADRVDYALREFKYWLNPSAVRESIKGLINYNGEIIFNNVESAYVFSSNFLELQFQHWGGFEGVTRYNHFSEALKIALEDRTVKENDFFKTDPYILKKLEGSRSEKVKEILKMLQVKNLGNLKENGREKVYKKFRYVDPKVLTNGKLTRLSKLKPTFGKLLAKHRKINSQGILV